MRCRVNDEGQGKYLSWKKPPQCENIIRWGRRKGEKQREDYMIIYFEETPLKIGST